MKRFLCVLTAGSALLALAGDTTKPAAAPPAPASSTPGRYQIIAGNVYEEDTGHQRPLLVKLDTVTGETWGLYRLPANKGERKMYVTGWAKLFDNGPAAVMVQEKSAELESKHEPRNQSPPN